MINIIHVEYFKFDIKSKSEFNNSAGISFSKALKRYSDIYLNIQVPETFEEMKQNFSYAIRMRNNYVLINKSSTVSFNK